MLLIENSIKPDMPVLPIEEKPELGSVLDLLSAECLARHPMVSRRYELFPMEQSAGSTLTEYINRLRDTATNAELAAIEPNDFICFYALATCKDTFQTVKEDALKLPPEELNLERLMTLARQFETAGFALNDMNRQGSATSNNTHSRGGGGPTSKQPPPKGMAPYVWEHIKKLRAEKKCTRCVQSIEKCPEQSKCWVLKSDQSCLHCSSGDHLVGACAKKANGITPSEAPKGKGKKNTKCSNYQKGKNGATSVRATDEQQQHPASDTDDDEPAAASASFTYMTGWHLQLATDESDDDEPAREPSTKKREPSTKKRSVQEPSTQLCTKIFPALQKLLQSGHTHAHIHD